MSPSLTFLLEIMDAVSSGLKRRETLACYQRSVQKPASLMVWGCISAYGMGSLQHMLPSRWRLFQGRSCVFQQDNAKPHTAAITTAWLHSRRVRVLNWPACSPDLSPIQNIWLIIKRKIEGECYTMVNMTPSQLFWDLRQAYNLKWAHFVHNILKCLTLNICYVIYVLLWIKYCT